MKKQFPLFASLMLFLLLVLVACQKETAEKPMAIDQTPTPTEAVYYTPDISDFDIDIPEEGSAASLRSGYFTVVPAGSVDALADAIAGADPGGIIYLKAGMHTENQRVMVTKRVNIIGEDGAVLMVDSDPDGFQINPGIHLLNAPAAMIKNLDIRSNQGNGWSAILIENSPRAAVLNSEMSDYIFAIIVEKSDQVALIGNQIYDSGNNGILINEGKSNYIANNEIAGTQFSGVWACDEWGTIENNYLHDNGGGMLLCKYNIIFGVTTPAGEPLGTDVSATGWKVRGNNIENSLEAGISVTDGAKLNTIESSNTYSNNGTYDIIVPPDRDIPNFLFIPAGHDNTIHAEPSVLIKDCGINTTIFGGTLVDTNVDPC